MRLKKMMVLGLMLSVSACSQRSDVAYCERMGTPPGTPHYASCISHFTSMQNWFNADRMGCSAQADQTYPQSLYDRGSYGIMRGGIGFGHGMWGPAGFGNVGFGGFGGGPFWGSRMVDIAPDPFHNAQVDALRMRIIQPCMEAKGWNSGASWEAGRKDKMTRPNASGDKLPWRKN